MLMTSWIVVAECRRACQRVVFGIGTAWAVRVDHPTHLGSLIKSQIRTPAVRKHRYICHKLLYSLHLPFTEHAADNPAGPRARRWQATSIDFACEA
jgi:hypothetical protein